MLKMTGVWSLGKALGSAALLIACSDGAAGSGEEPAEAGAMSAGGAVSAGGAMSAGGAGSGGAASSNGGTSAGGVSAGGALQTSGAPPGGAQGTGGVVAAGGSIEDSGAGGSVPDDAEAGGADGGDRDAGDAGGAPGADAAADAPAAEAAPECECSSGECCDGCHFRDFGYLCGSYVSASECPPSSKPACPGHADNVWKDYRRRFCSGKSPECDGHTARWQSVSETCAPGNFCIDDNPGTNTAACGPCPN